MLTIDRLPAIPLITSDPYLSIWMPADTLTQTEACHWSGVQKPIHGVLTVDETSYRFLGVTSDPEAKLTELTITPTTTRFVSEAGGVRLTTSFTAPALPQNTDLMSMPVTLAHFSIASSDGLSHKVKLALHIADRFCYDGEIRPSMINDTFILDEYDTAWCGQSVQKPLSHSGDHVTIDWGYLYLSANTSVISKEDGLYMTWEGSADGEVRAIIAYDDIASVNYFGDLCKAWYCRNGANITDAIKLVIKNYERIIDDCSKMDSSIIAEAKKAGGNAYVKIICASWRQTLAAHKLIATPKCNMVLLSKENDSNGCIGTVDVSYPSIPLFLHYNPELVNALCRPILEFASMPVWQEDFAPHDVGRYPYATGQVYAARRRIKNGEIHPLYYLYPAGTDVYDPRYQMPVEEAGNMLVMLEAAIEYGADRSLADQYRGLLDQWVQYLLRYGEDPGEQLCTDDFAGHLAHNCNLAAKAIVGVACYGRLTANSYYEELAKSMALRYIEKIGITGNTPLTLDGQGWSMKYNLLWDKILNLHLMPDSFYAAEIASYLPRINRYGLPLDSRADYTKSDWICWIAALADNIETREALLEPIALMLIETTSRVPFSDWYDTKTGKYQKFIARSVQGGVFAPLLTFKSQTSLNQRLSISAIFKFSDEIISHAFESIK